MKLQLFLLSALVGLAGWCVANDVPLPPVNVEAIQVSEPDAIPSVALNVEKIEAPTTPGATFYPTSELPHLSILYLVPNDMDPLPDYRQRLGKILLEIELFYNKELARNGSSARLRMPRDPKTGLVSLEEVKGSQPLKGYPYAGGWKGAMKDVEAYLKAHPHPVRSDRTLIIIPTTDEKPDVPFYGFGKACFALDYPGFDWKDCGKANTPAGEKFRPWYGGMAHELAHGLGLPHNHATRSNEKLYGTTLLAHGNCTLGFSPTFLTPADCAFLESSPPCRVFEPRPLKKADKDLLIAVVPVAETFRICGKLPMESSVRRVVVHYDKDKHDGVNNNYDAESWVLPFGTDGYFDFVFPQEEIHPGKTKSVQIQLYLIHDDGTSEMYRYTHTKA